MPPVQTFSAEHHYSVFRDVIAPTRRIQIGGGATGHRRLYERPTYRFRLHATHEDQQAIQQLYSFAYEHQGDIPFLFDGGEWGTISSPVHVGWGTGTGTNYFLPNRRIVPGTVLVYVNGVLAGVQPTLTSASGLIVFGVAPALNARITATYQCQYLVVFGQDGEVLLSEENFAHHLFSVEGLVFQEIVP